MMKKSRALFIRGGRVLSDGMAVDRPAPQDILIEDGVIRAIRVGMLTSYHPLEMTRYVPSLAETDPA
jgi:hypothetical protein